MQVGKDKRALKVAKRKVRPAAGGFVLLLPAWLLCMAGGCRVRSCCGQLVRLAADQLPLAVGSGGSSVGQRRRNVQLERGLEPASGTCSTCAS